MHPRYRPMLATLIDAPFNNKDWVFETKWDGFRLIAVIAGGGATLYTRNGTDVTSRYPAIAKALSKTGGNAVIDGELVALDSRGNPNFQLLQNALNKNARLQYCAFDLLFFKGKDLRARSLLERKALLKESLVTGPLVRYSAHKAERGVALFKEAKKRKLEGIIAKRAAGLYYSGKRTREWLKIKTGLRQEVVIVGFTKPRASRAHFGALVLAVREGGRWRYVGRAGTGFTASTLKTLHKRMLPLRTARKPLQEKIPDEASTTWLKPSLVGEVKFTEWTSAGEMRHPSFIAMREDKPAMNVVRELPS